MSMVTERERVVFFGGFMMTGGRAGKRTLLHDEAMFNPNPAKLVPKTSPGNPNLEFKQSCAFCAGIPEQVLNAHRQTPSSDLWPLPSGRERGVEYD
jgi:hypothetical protein